MGGSPAPAGTGLAPESLSHVHGLSLNIRLRAASVPSLHVLELIKAQVSLRHAQLKAGPRAQTWWLCPFQPQIGAAGPGAARAQPDASEREFVGLWPQLPPRCEGSGVGPAVPPASPITARLLLVP